MDARFNNLVLEHGYQSLIGNCSFASPDQFAPVKGTIAHSDMHLGTLPLYSLIRVVGFPIERSFQIWSVGIGFLNGLAFLLLLRALRTPWALTGPLVMVGVSSASMVAFVGTHIQIFPVFPFLLALRRWVLFTQDWRISHLFYGFGFLALLHLCSPYLGFFGTLAAGLIVVVSCVAFQADLRQNIEFNWGSLKKMDWSKPFALTMGFCAAWMYWTYFAFSVEKGGREWEMIYHLTPHWKLWSFSPQPHWLYGDFFSWGKSYNNSEHSMFSGVIPWLAIMAGIVVFCFNRRYCKSKWLTVFTFSGVGLILYFTRWDDSGSGIFLWMAKQVESLTAFRSSSRSIVIIHLLQVLALSSLLTIVYRNSKSAKSRGVVVLFAVVAAIEGTSLRQNTSSIDQVVKRSEGVLDAWRQAGDKPILLFAPGAFNGSPRLAHLDAWSAAIRSGRKSVNGYSGSVPDSHNMFLLKPTRENAENLIRYTGLDSDQVSIVESWGNREELLGIKRYDSDRLIHLDGFEVQPNWWKYSFPVVGYPIDGTVFYEFTPILSARFKLPDDARNVSMLVGIREGAYTEGASSDGVGMRWSIDLGGEVILVEEVYLNPRDNLSQRGYLPYSLEIPSGFERELLLEVDGGPEKNTAWDWLMIGKLTID